MAFHFPLMPRMFMIKDFADNLDRINALAESSPGFVWRLKGDGNNATDLSIDGDPLYIPNLSVWEDIPSLGAFVYRSAHVEIMGVSGRISRHSVVRRENLRPWMETQG